MKFTKRMKHPLIKVWLVVGITAGFSAILFFIISYIKNVMLCDATCSVQNDVAVAIVLSALIGVFVGSLTYYFIAERYEQKLSSLHQRSKSFFRLLEPDTRKVIETLIEHNGILTQHNLVEKTGLSRVKISRIIAVLEGKQILKKEQTGMTNTVFLVDDFKEIFFQHSDK
ncbi:MAG: helix-turn-helix transcriptional regulator [Nanobdellota archaeon]